MPSWPLDLELLQLTPSDKWTLQRAVAGVIVLGATRSGKTSGPFQYVVRSFLRAGFGGVFFCVKPDSMTDYKKFVRAEGMDVSGDPKEKDSKDVILFGPSHGHRFNFLSWEMERQGEGKAIIENIVEVLIQASEILSRKYGHGKGDEFFQNAMRQLLRNCLEVVIAATDEISLEEILTIVQTLPTSTQQVDDDERGGSGAIHALKMLRKAEDRAKDKPHLKKGLELARNYFTKEWPLLNDRTRSSIAITLTVLMDAFLRYPLRDLFCSDKPSTVKPDDVLKGKILIVDVPVNRYYEFGKIAAVLWKSAIQRAILSRPELHAENLGEQHLKRERPDDIDNMRPIFLAGDEAQYFISSSDVLFATTSASARGITVYATQSLALLYSEMGSDANARSSVLALLGNLRNCMVCNCSDPETTTWFANTLGKVIIKRRSIGQADNMAFGPGGVQINRGDNVNEAEQLDYDLQPRELAILNQGGPHRDKMKDRKVEAIITTAGWPFEFDGELWHKATFDQNLKSDSTEGGFFAAAKSLALPKADEVRIIAKRQR